MTKKTPKKPPRDKTYDPPSSLLRVKDVSNADNQPGPSALGTNPKDIQRGVVESESANRGKAALYRGSIMDSGCLDLIVKMAMTGFDYSFLEVPVPGNDVDPATGIQRIEVKLVRGDQLDETTKAKYLQLLLNKTVGTAATQKESVQEPVNSKWIQVIQQEKDKLEVTVDVDVSDDETDDGDD